MLSPIDLIDDILDAIDLDELSVQNGVLQLRFLNEFKNIFLRSEMWNLIKLLSASEVLCILQ